MFISLLFFYLTGFALGEQFFNQESLYIRNQSFWTFEIRKFTFMVLISIIPTANIILFTDM